MPFFSCTPHCCHSNKMWSQCSSAEHRPVRHHLSQDPTGLAVAGSSSGCRPGLGFTLWGKAVPSGESERGHRSPRADPEVPKMERHLLALLFYCYRYGPFRWYCPLQQFIALI